MNPRSNFAAWHMLRRMLQNWRVVRVRFRNNTHYAVRRGWIIHKFFDFDDCKSWRVAGDHWFPDCCVPEGVALLYYIYGTKCPPVDIQFDVLDRPSTRLISIRLQGKECGHSEP